MRTLPALIALALVLPACAKKKEVHLPTKPQGSGFMSAVPFDGEVVGTDVRFDLDKNQVLDLIRGTSPSEGNAVGIPQKFHFGVAERVAELSWVLSKSTSQGDHYEFTLRYPLGQASEREQKKQVIYSGEPHQLFTYANHEILLRPPSAEPDADEEGR